MKYLNQDQAVTFLRRIFPAPTATELYDMLDQLQVGKGVWAGAYGSLYRDTDFDDDPNCPRYHVEPCTF